MSKLTHQLNVRVSADVYERIEKLARKDRRTLGEVARMIMEGALQEAERNESLARFSDSRTLGAPYSTRVSEVTQEQVRAGLRIIFENAPLPVVERVTEFISERAARYQEANSGVPAQRRG